MKNLKEKNLEKSCARLESQIDVLETEIRVMDKLLLDVGFPEGIRSLKKAAEELLSDEYGFQKSF